MLVGTVGTTNGELLIATFAIWYWLVAVLWSLWLLYELFYALYVLLYVVRDLVVHGSLCVLRVVHEVRQVSVLFVSLTSRT